MRSKYSKQEKFDLIMKCRSSGLSDFQWCKRNGVSMSTFYGWTQQLKKSGFTLPEPTDRESFSPAAKQDIVKLELVEDILLPTDAETRNTPVQSSIPNSCHTVEIEIGHAKIKISNDVKPTLLAQIITGLGGCL